MQNVTTSSIPPTSGHTDLDMVLRTIADGERTVRDTHAVKAPSEDAVFAREAYLDFLNDAAETIRERGEEANLITYTREMSGVLLPMLIHALEMLEDSDHPTTVHLAQGIDDLIGVLVGLKRAKLIPEEELSKIFSTFSAAITQLRRTIVRRRKDNPAAFTNALDALEEYTFNRGFELAHTVYYAWAEYLVTAGKIKVLG